MTETVAAAGAASGARWVRRRERGSLFLMRLIAWIALGLGRPVARILLYPICAYFVVFDPRGSRASRAYLVRALGRPPGLGDVFRHYYCFASTLLDRVFLLSGRHSVFAFSVRDPDRVDVSERRGRACLLLGAHLGSFEAIRVFGARQRGLKINILMYEENARKVNRVLGALGRGDAPLPVIPIGGVDALLRAQTCVERGEMVAMLGDRAAMSDKVVRVPFLGAPAQFPAGPVLLAAMLKLPVVLFFGIHEGGNRYALHFERFADEIVLGRATRQADLERWVARYAARLEHHCRLAPYNWFNFYDFWEPDGAANR